MTDVEHASPREAGIAIPLAFACCSIILALLMGVNYRLYGSPYASTKQVAIGVLALAIGAVLAVRAAWARRWQRCAFRGVMSVGLAAVGWWLVPIHNGANLARLHYLALAYQLELRNLPLGEFTHFRRNMTSRDDLVGLLPRMGRSIRVDEVRWLNDSLCSTISEAEAKRASDPSSALAVMQEALLYLPGPGKYQSDAAADAADFVETWRRAKTLRLETSKAATLPKILNGDYRTATAIAAALRAAAVQDDHRDEAIDEATSQFIDSIQFLNSLNELGQRSPRIEK
jgi:hypothetical protein